MSRRRAADAAHPRHGPAARRAGDPRPARCLPAAGLPRPGAHGPGEPHHLCPLLRHPAAGGAAAGSRAARLRAADRAGQQQGRSALRRHEAPADYRPGTGQRAGDRAARRAHDRSRPAGPPSVVGAAVPAQAAGGDAGADHPLHGRGGAVVRPAGGDGRRPDRGRGSPRSLIELHAWNPPFKWMKPIWRNHHLHHYKNDEKGFGVSSHIWDKIFGTAFDLNKEKEDKEAAGKLMFQRRSVQKTFL